MVRLQLLQLSWLIVLGWVLLPGMMSVGRSEDASEARLHTGNDQPLAWLDPSSPLPQPPSFRGLGGACNGACSDGGWRRLTFPLVAVDKSLLLDFSHWLSGGRRGRRIGPPTGPVGDRSRRSCVVARQGQASRPGPYFCHTSSGEDVNGTE